MYSDEAISVEKANVDYTLKNIYFVYLIKTLPMDAVVY